MRSSALKKQELPATITEELQIIQSMNGGLLEPVHVVEYAKNPDTLLHGKFEWIDSKAAHSYRIWQARQLISLELLVIDKKGETPSDLFLTVGSEKDLKRKVRAFVSLTNDRYGDNKGYRNIYDVVVDDDLRAQLLEDARQDMLIFRRKYQLLKELAGVFEAMDKV